MSPLRPTNGLPRRWDRLPEERLLELRPSQLGLRLAGSRIEPNVRRLRQEFADRGFRFRPHCWLSVSWFSPSGIPGIAIPFFLAHPRLRRLELSQMGEVEGGTDEYCMRLLRHEAGHAVDTAYRLHRRSSWRETFGAWGEPYEDTYKPRPYDRRFVLHLDHWYAQSHPAEDFAETFAVWLGSRTDWREDYAGWGALAKLELVDRMMEEVRSLPAPVNSREHCEPINEVRATLGTLYARRRRARQGQRDDYYDREVRALFQPRSNQRPPAGPWLRGVLRELRARLGPADRERAYNVEQVLGGLTARAEKLRLTLDDAPHEERVFAVLRTIEGLLTRLHDGYFRVAR